MLAASPEQLRRRTGEAVETMLQRPAWADGRMGAGGDCPASDLTAQFPTARVPFIFHEGAAVAFAVHCRADGKPRAGLTFSSAGFLRRCLEY